MNPESDVRTHVVLPKDFVATIDRLVGQGGRSQFLADAARRQIAYLELLEVARAAAGSAKGKPSPWGDTTESIATWVAESRGDDRARDDALDVLRGRLGTAPP